MMHVDDAQCQLPLELLLTIITNVHPHTFLLPLSLTSSVFREEAQRILFREPQLPNPLSHLIFLNNVIASPHRLALFVKTYTQFGVLDDVEPTPQLIQTLHNRTASALRVMVNLEKLGFRATMCDIPTPSMAHILRGCSFQLHALAWVCNANDVQVLLQEILPGQKALRHLGLLRAGDLSSNDILSAKSLCPELVSLAGPATIFPALLPGRNIRYLHWTLGPTSNGANSNLASLPSEFFNVDSLVFHIHLDFPLHAMTEVLRSVKFLMIFSHNEMWIGFPELPSLEILLVTIDTTQRQCPLRRKTRRNCAVAIFRQCKALQYIDWQAEPQTFFRYTVSNLDAGELNVTHVARDKALPWKDWVCFGDY